MKKNIIIVEDEIIIAQDMKYELEQFGYNVLDIVSSSNHLFELLDQKVSVDLILMDIMINGDMDGVDVAKIVYDKYQYPVVFLTAYSDEITLKRAKTAKPFGYLIKPFVVRELYTVMEMAIFRHSMEREYIEYKNILHGVINSVDEGVIVVNEHEEIVFVNNYVKEILKKSDCKGELIDDVYVKRRIKSDEIIQFALKEINRIAYFSLKINGADMIVEEKITNIKSSGRESGFVIVFRVV